jgi:hypothetical protein
MPNCCLASAISLSKCLIEVESAILAMGIEIVIYTVAFYAQGSRNSFCAKGRNFVISSELAYILLSLKTI